MEGLLNGEISETRTVFKQKLPEKQEINDCDKYLGQSISSFSGIFFI